MPWPADGASLADDRPAGYPGHGPGYRRRAVEARDYALWRTRRVFRLVAGSSLAAALGLGVFFAQALPGHGSGQAAGTSPGTGSGSGVSGAGSAAGGGAGGTGAQQGTSTGQASQPAPPAPPPAPAPQVVSGGS